MQYLGYLLIAIAFYAGYHPWHPGVVIGLALASTLLFSSARRQALKSEPHQANPNMFLDGAFLFGQQVLLMFFMYAFGWMLANLFV